MWHRYCQLFRQLTWRRCHLSVFLCFSLPQAFRPPCKLVLSALSELRRCFPHDRGGNTISNQLFYLVTNTPQVWVTNEHCDWSDADELAHCCRGSSPCAHWNAVRNSAKGKWSLRALVSYSLQFPSSDIQEIVALASISRGWVPVSSEFIELTILTDRGYSAGPVGAACPIWVQPQACLDGWLRLDFLHH